MNGLEKYNLPFKNTAALVPAAGLGTRLGLGPKAFLQLGGKTLLERTIDLLSPCVSEILVAVPEDYMEQAKSIVKDRATLYVGGNTFPNTVFRLFEKTEAQFIVIQLVVGMFTTQKLIHQAIETAFQHEIVASSSVPTAPIGHIQTTIVNDIFFRKNTVILQPPYVFHKQVLQQIYQYVIKEEITPQGLLDLIPKIGKCVKVIEGEETNIKLTTLLDWEIAQKVIAPKFGWV